MTIWRAKGTHLKCDEQREIQIGIFVFAATRKSIFVPGNHLAAKKRSNKVRVEHPSDHL